MMWKGRVGIYQYIGMSISQKKPCSLADRPIYSLFGGEEYSNPIATQNFYLDIAMMSLGDLELDEFFFFRTRSRGISDGCQQIVLQQLFRQPNEIVSHLPSGCCVILCNSSGSPRSVWLVPVFLENTTRDVPDAISNQSGTSPIARKNGNPPFWRRSWLQYFVQFFVQFLANFLSMWLFEYINR